jgi:mRNA interferase MazF
MRRGDVVWADLGHPRGREASHRRPVVIVSHEALNRVVAGLGRGVVTVVPITSNVERVYPFQVFLGADETGLPADGKAQAEQARAIDVERLRPGAIGELPAERLRQLDEALRLHLAL